MAGAPSFAEALLDALPQTQCRRCGYADCRGYATALAAGQADINRCPPGGAEGVARLARLTGRATAPLAAQCGAEEPRTRAVIDEHACIGCALCLKACPADAISGAAKHMHTVIEALCTGCELCLPACPVDCIALVAVSGSHTGWDAWSESLAGQARRRYEAQRARLGEAGSDEEQPDADEAAATRREAVAAAVGRARAAREGSSRPESMP